MKKIFLFFGVATMVQAGKVILLHKEILIKRLKDNGFEHFASNTNVQDLAGKRQEIGIIVDRVITLVDLYKNKCELDRQEISLSMSLPGVEIRLLKIILGNNKRALQEQQAFDYYRDIQ